MNLYHGPLPLGNTREHISKVRMRQCMPATENALFHCNLYNHYQADTIIPTLLIFRMRQGQNLILQMCFVLESLISRDRSS